MAFLTAEDYGALIKQEQLDIVLSGNPSALAKCEVFAQGLIESYLRTRYDAAATFEATGEDRNDVIVTYMVDITLYTVHSRHGRVQMPEKRIVRYEQAIEWLKAVSKGTLSVSLPRLAEKEQSGRFKWGSQPKQNLTW